MPRHFIVSFYDWLTTRVDDTYECIARVPMLIPPECEDRFTITDMAYVDGVQKEIRTITGIVKSRHWKIVNHVLGTDDIRIDIYADIINISERDGE